MHLNPNQSVRNKPSSLSYWLHGFASDSQDLPEDDDIIVSSILVTVLQKSEIDRALEYLENLQKNLKDLKTHLRKLNTSTAILTDDISVEHFKNICTDLIKRSNQIEVICDKVEDSIFF